MKTTSARGLSTYTRLRLNSRHTAIHAEWLQRLGAAKIAWGVFIGSSRLQIEGHEQRVRALRELRAVRPRAGTGAASIS